MELTEGRVLILLDRSRIFRHRGRENGCLSEIWIYSATRGGAGVGRSSHMTMKITVQSKDMGVGEGRASQRN